MGRGRLIHVSTALLVDEVVARGAVVGASG